MSEGTVPGVPIGRRARPGAVFPPARRPPRRSRRALLAGAAGSAAMLVLAACGAPRTVERIVVRPVVVERVVITERPVVIEHVVTRLVTPTPAPTPTPALPPAVTTPTPAPQPRQRTLRVVIGGAPRPDVGKQRLASFMARQPDVRPRVAFAAAGRDAQAAVLAQAAAGVLPDALVAIPGDTLAMLAADDALADLASAATTVGLDPAVLALGRHDDTQAGLPLSGFATHVYVNQSSLESAGVAATGDSYPAMLESARQLTDPDRDAYGWGAAADLPELETIAGSAGGAVWTARGTATGIDQDAFVDAWQWQADLVHREHVAPPPAAWDGRLGAHVALGAGRVAMLLRSGWVLEAAAATPARLRAPIEIRAVPAWPGFNRAAPFNASYAAVAASSDAFIDARHLIEFLATEGYVAAEAAGIPAWPAARATYAGRTGVETDRLVELRAGWRRPALDHAHSVDTAEALLPAISDVIAGGEPAAEHAAAVASRLARLV